MIRGLGLALGLGLAAAGGAAAAPAAATDHLLYPDPMDEAPLGDRIPVVLTPGYRADQAAEPFDPERNRDLDPIRHHPRYLEAMARCKFYLFQYRSWQAYPDLGAHLAEALVAQVLPEAPAATPVVFLGYSAGALACRYAAADPRLVPRTLAILTLAGAHRGAVTSSILRANAKVQPRIGWAMWKLFDHFRQGVPETPAELSLAYDNFDGSIDAFMLEQAGLRENPALRDFNQTDPNLGKIVAYMSRNRSLWRRSWNDEVRRRVVASFHPSWSTADPIVHFESGAFVGAPIAARRLFEDETHASLLSLPALHQALFDDLEALVSQGTRALTRWQRFAAPRPGQPPP